jgi:hypothetical protein
MERSIAAPCTTGGSVFFLTKRLIEQVARWLYLHRGYPQAKPMHCPATALLAVGLLCFQRQIQAASRNLFRGISVSSARTVVLARSPGEQRLLSGVIMKALRFFALATTVCLGLMSFGCETSHSTTDKSNLLGGTTHEETTTTHNPITGTDDTTHTEQKN